eukprot:GHVP01020060.1.p2 GENE.GHVP01020060.1~~GHVP01020060.1.p2  ORF type:complete len:203 (+),score=42.05 GHVP01020060.1:1516-2124(+)
MDSCPVCKNDSYLDPSIRILVPPCFHRLCVVCIERIFRRGTKKCPDIDCEETLKKTSYVVPFFDDLRMERETRLRKRINPYKRPSNSFDTIKEYNDYLEGLEDTFEAILLAGSIEAEEAMFFNYIESLKNTNKIKSSKEVKKEPILTENKKEYVNVKEMENNCIKEALEELGLSFTDLKSAQKRSIYDTYNNKEIEIVFNEL